MLQIVLLYITTIVVILRYQVFAKFLVISFMKEHLSSSKFINGKNLHKIKSLAMRSQFESLPKRRHMHEYSRRGRIKWLHVHMLKRIHRHKLWNT
jgi:hypothetical protein